MKTLLLTDIPPCKDYTAGLVLDQLCRFFQPGEIACFNISDPTLQAEMSSDLSWIARHSCRRPFEAAGTVLPGIFGKVSSVLAENVNALVKVPKIVHEAISFGKKIQADRVWCILQGQTMVRVARPTAKGLDVPLLVQVWDPLEWWLRAHKVNDGSSAALLREFKRIMETCQGCFTASPAMAEEYNRRYGVRSVYFVPSLDEELARSPAQDFSSKAEFVIAMVGQLYAKEEWDVLLGALNLMEWKINNKEVRIVLVGRHDTLELPKWAESKITKTGWISQLETIDLCSKYDLLYCPYWFSKEFEEEARLSFPSKLTTYLASGRPVLFHGPHYSSPAKFIRDNDCGFLCHSKNLHEMCKLLKAISEDNTRYTLVTTNGTTAFLKHMTTSLMRHQFEKFIGF